MVTPSVTLGRRDRDVALALAARRVPRLLLAGAALFVLVWVLIWAPDTNSLANGAAIHDPLDFLYTTLDSLTFAGILFIVASGFTLMFGLMRVVNMAHGSFYLLGGLIAYKLENDFAHGGGFGLSSNQVSAWQWILPVLIASLCMAVIGLVTQQGFLRWNQGQDLRQAMITIALSVILSDQMLTHFGSGNSQNLTFPDFIGTDKFLKAGGFQYSWARLFMLFVAIGVGGALWLWLQRTRTGMVIRAGVDDRQMVSALGVNIQLVFALAFVVGGLLVGLGGAMGGSEFVLQTDVQGQWLLNSLIVVIIGGMGSLGGAAVGAILYGFVSDFSATYLPTTSNNCCTEYSIVFTFALLAAVLALRPLGLFGRPA